MIRYNDAKKFSTRQVIFKKYLYPPEFSSAINSSLPSSQSKLPLQNLFMAMHCLEVRHWNVWMHMLSHSSVESPQSSKPSQVCYKNNSKMTKINLNHFLKLFVVQQFLELDYFSVLTIIKTPIKSLKIMPPTGCFAVKLFRGVTANLNSKL